MSSFFTFVFSALLIIIWIIAGGFITQTSVLLHPHRDKDSNLHRAYWYSFWAAFVTWTLVAIFLILIVLAVVGVVGLFSTGVGEEATAADYLGGSSVTSNISWLTVAFLVLALILVSVTGVLSALTASNIKASPNYKPTDPKMKKAYDNAIIAASMCLGAGGLLIIGMISYFVLAWQEGKKAQEAAAAKAAKEEADQQAVNKLKGDLVRQSIAQQIALREARINSELTHLNVQPVSG